MGTALVNDPGKITCYDFDGTPFGNNTQCDGSNICCADTSQCQQNRFCLKPSGQLVRPVCSRFPWTNCSPLCQYESGTGFLPRLNQCSDGSYCCDNDPACCASNRGVVLNGSGQVVSTNSPTSSTASATSTTTSPTTVSTTNTAQPITGTTAPGPMGGAGSSRGGLSTAASAGIGVGAGLIVILLAGALIYFCIHRRRIRRLEAELAERDRAAQIGNTGYMAADSSSYYQPSYEVKPFVQSEPAELGTGGVGSHISELPASERRPVPPRKSLRSPIR